MPKKWYFAGDGNTIETFGIQSRKVALSTFASGTHIFLRSDALALLCCIVCIEILHVHIYRWFEYEEDMN